MAVEQHPNWYHEVPNMRVLILGTFPPHQEGRDVEFYYPKLQNRFWEVLAKATGFDLLETRLKKEKSAKKMSEKEKAEIVADRKKLMSEHNIGVQNLGKTIIRLNGTSAKDKDIQITEYQDIQGIVERSPLLKTIQLTGYSDKTSTYNDFIRYLDKQKIKYAPHEKATRAGLEFEIAFSRPLTCIIGNSTSGQAFGVKTETLIEQFKKAIFR